MEVHSTREYKDKLAKIDPEGAAAFVYGPSFVHEVRY